MARLELEDRGKWLTFVSAVAFLMLAPLAVLAIHPTLEALAPGRFWPLWLSLGIALGPLVFALYFRLLWPRGYPDVLVMLCVSWWVGLLLLLFQEEMLGGHLGP